MSVLIKGITLKQFYKDLNNVRDMDADWDIVQLPPHGRLIDADVFKKSLSTLLQFPSNLVNGQWIINTIREQPTIIEADGGET